MIHFGCNGFVSQVKTYLFVLLTDNSPAYYSSRQKIKIWEGFFVACIPENRGARTQSSALILCMNGESGGSAACQLIYIDAFKLEYTK